MTSITTKITNSELRRLKKALPEKAIEKLAKKFQVSSSYIRMILSNERDNEQVISAAIEMAKMENARKLKLKKAINQL